MASASGRRLLRPLLSLSLLVAVSAGCQNALVPTTNPPERNDDAHDLGAGNGAVSLKAETGSASEAKLYQVDVFEVGPDGEKLVSTRTLDALDGTVLKGLGSGKYRLRATPLDRNGLPAGKPLTGVVQPSSAAPSPISLQAEDPRAPEEEFTRLYPVTPVDEHSHTSLLREDNIEKARALFNTKFPEFAYFVSKQKLEFGETLDPPGSDHPGEFSRPLPFLTPAQLQKFNEGRQVFINEPEVQEQGGRLVGPGPIMNYHGCSGCHRGSGGLGGGDMAADPLGREHAPRLVPRFGRWNHDGTFDPLLDKGGLVMQRDRIGPPDISDDHGPFLAADELGNIVVNHQPVTLALLRARRPPFGPRVRAGSG